MGVVSYTGNTVPAYERPSYNRDSVPVNQVESDEAVDRPNASAMLDAVCHQSGQLLPRLNQLLGCIENQNYGEAIQTQFNPVPQPVQTINIRLMNACDNVNEAHQILNAIEAALGV